MWPAGFISAFRNYYARYGVMLGWEPDNVFTNVLEPTKDVQMRISKTILNQKYLRRMRISANPHVRLKNVSPLNVMLSKSARTFVIIFRIKLNFLIWI